MSFSKSFVLNTQAKKDRYAADVLAGTEAGQPDMLINMENYVRAFSKYPVYKSKNVRKQFGVGKTTNPGRVDIPILRPVSPDSQTLDEVPMALLKTKAGKDRYNADHKIAASAGREDIRDRMRISIRRFRAYPIQQSRVFLRLIFPETMPVAPISTGTTEPAKPADRSAPPSVADRSVAGAMTLPDISGIPGVAAISSFAASIPGVSDLSAQLKVPPAAVLGVVVAAVMAVMKGKG